MRTLRNIVAATAAAVALLGAGQARADLTNTASASSTPVPEPASYALLGLGALVGLIGRRALRRRTA